MEWYRYIFGKLVWHWLDVTFRWLVFFYVIRTGMYFIKNKKIFKELRFTPYIWIACGIGILAVLLYDVFKY